MNILLIILTVIQIALIITMIILIATFHKYMLGFGLLIDKFFDQSDKEIKSITKVINTSTEEMNTVIRSIQRIKRER